MKICIIYLDDLIIFSENFEQHLERLDLVLKRLQEYNLKLSGEKCYFLQRKVKFLGHVVSDMGIETDPDKIDKVRKWPSPSNADELRSFMAFAGYYRRFIQNFSQITKPLNQLLPSTTPKKRKRSNQEWHWGEEEEKTFQELKLILTSPPILAYPDFKQPFILHTDASGKGLGAVLYQQQDGLKKVIAYASRSLSKSEKNYPAFKLEFLALKWAITEKFSDYLSVNHFVVYTDNNPLTHILSTAKLDATGQRWVSALAQYNFDIKYKPGSTNKDADGLSRYPFHKEDTQEITVEDGTIKALCGSINICANVETTQAPEVNVAEFDRGDISQKDLREIRKAQRDDKTVGPWVTATVSGKMPPRIDTSREDQTMRRNFGHFKMMRGTLYRQIVDGEETVLQLVLPKVFRQEVLKSLHSEMGHPGRDRTLGLVRQRFFWPGMTADIESYIQNCERCLRSKTQLRGNRAPLVNITTTYPLELVCIDYLTLEESKGGISNILVMTDHFTKYAVAIPTKNQTAKVTADTLLEHFILHYGIPSKIHSDQGATFESELIQELCKLLNIQKTRTSPYHPQGNGITERYNRTLIGMLSTLDSEKKHDWKKYVQTMTYSYNCMEHSSTKYSPFELMYGRKPRLPVDLKYETAVTALQNKDYDKYISDLQERMKKTQTVVKEHMKVAGNNQKKHYDLKAHAVKLEVGDKVLVKMVAFEGKHKLADKFEDGVYTIIDQPNGDIPVYTVRAENGKERRLHRNLIFPLGNRIWNEKHPVPVPRKGHCTEESPETVEVERETRDDTENVEVERETQDDTDDSDVEYVVHTYSNGDAHMSESENRYKERRNTEKSGSTNNETSYGESSENNGSASLFPDQESEKADTVRSNPSAESDHNQLGGDAVLEEQNQSEDSDLDNSDDSVFEQDPGMTSKDDGVEANTPSKTSPPRPTPRKTSPPRPVPRRSTRDRRPPQRFGEAYIGAVNRVKEMRLKTLCQTLNSGALDNLETSSIDKILDIISNI